VTKVLLTNDDGVHSPGIHAMAVALRDAGHDVMIVAPSGERSGWGAGVGTLLDGVEVEVTAHRVPDADDIVTWAVDGPPAFCVLTAMLETYGPRPELVASGINDGTNCGRGVLQSGTVGGALIAQNFGLSALAISQKVTDGPMLWETGAAVSVAAIDWLADAPRKTVLNVNVPNVALADLAGVRWGRLAAFGTTSTSLEGAVPGTLTVRVTPRDVELKPDTDTALVDAGYVAVTGLSGIRAESEDSGPAAGFMEAALG
jgi:5'-nucleotidase